MSFDIQIMRNLSEQNRLEKNLETLTTVNGTLRETTSILSPKIMISGSLSALSSANYFHIPSLNRYYFLTDLQSVRNGLIEISGRVDVLTTYADAIKSNKGIVRRQENEWNLHINDGSLKAYQNPFVITNYFPTGFSGHGFILAVAGSQ